MKPALTYLPTGDPHEDQRLAQLAAHLQQLPTPREAILCLNKARHYLTRNPRGNAFLMAATLLVMEEWAAEFEAAMISRRATTGESTVPRERATPFERTKSLERANIYECATPLERASQRESATITERATLTERTKDDERAPGRERTTERERAKVPESTTSEERATYSERTQASRASQTLRENPVQ